MRVLAVRVTLSCVFLALGWLLACYSLPGPGKLILWLGRLWPGVMRSLKPEQLQFTAGVLNFTAGIALLRGQKVGKYAAIVSPRQTAVLLNILFFGNCILPRLTEQERISAILVAFKSVGLIGCLLLL